MSIYSLPLPWLSVDFTVLLAADWAGLAAGVWETTGRLNAFGVTADWLAALWTREGGVADGIRGGVALAAG